MELKNKAVKAIAMGSAALTLFMAAPVSAEGDADQGAKIFRRCQACHTVEEGKNRVGPTLYNVFGRKAGSVDSFTRYSDAVKSSGIVWDEESLSAYLEDPRGFIPGNTMAFPGLRDEQDRKDVIAFLKRVSENAE